MKLHDLKPAPGSRKARTRVGRGIAAGKGKTAGRGTKGQKSRAGATIPAWFEGGQTPMHIRLPKLHGFKQRGRIDYQVVNVGRISEYAVAGRFGAEAGNAPLTINGEVLLGAGLISTERRPVKVLGNGEVEAKLFVAADAFTKSARSKIEAAGGFVQLLAPERAPAPEAEPEPAPADPTEAAVAEPAETKPEARSSKGTRMARAEPGAQGGPKAEPDAQVEPEALELSAADDAEGDADSRKATATESKTAAARSGPSASAEWGTASEPAKAATKTTAKTATKRAAKPAASSGPVPADATAADAAAEDGTPDADAPADADADAPASKRGRTRKSADSADA